MTEKINVPLKQRTYFALPIEKVYDAITSPDCWNAFFTTGLEIDLKEGGEMWFRWENWGPDLYSVDVPCTVLTCDKPKLFSFEWGSTMKSTVEFHLEEQFGGTVMTVTEYGYPDTDDGLRNLLSCASGWGEAVTLLKFYLEHNVTYKGPK